MKDALGRRRASGQERGLRPLYPVLPSGVVSRSVRLAMSAVAWARLEGAAAPAPTRARSLGQVVERLLVDEPTAWLAWQTRKEQRLLA